MRKWFFIFVLLFSVVNLVFADIVKAYLPISIVVPKPIQKFDKKIFGFQEEQIVLETRDLGLAKSSRGLVLWTPDLEVRCEHDLECSYSCPKQTSGSCYYSCNANIAIVDISLNKIIKNIDLKVVSIPALIKPGYYYAVSGTANVCDERPVVFLNMLDFDGDGRPLEFASYFKDGCFPPEVKVYYFDEKMDEISVFRTKQYDIDGNGKYKVDMNHVGEMEFLKPFESPGVKAFPVHYGHGDEGFYIRKFNFYPQNHSCVGISLRIYPNGIKESSKEFDEESKKLNDKYLDQNGNLTKFSQEQIGKYWKLIKPHI